MLTETPFLARIERYNGYLSPSAGFSNPIESTSSGFYT